MHRFTYSAILVFISNFLIGFLVLLKGKDKRLNMPWFLLCMSVALWGIGGYIFSTTILKERAFIGWQIVYSGIIFTPLFYSHFIFTFLGLKRKVLLIVSYIYGGVCLFLNIFFRKLFLGDLRFTFNEFYFVDWTRYKSFMYLFFFIGFYLLLLGYSFFLLIRASYSERSRKNQIRYFLLAAAIGWTGALPCFLPTFGFDLYPDANFLIAVYPIFIAYAIVQYRLMDIDLVIKKGLIYSVLATVVTAGYFIFVLAVGRIFQNLAGYQSFIVNLSAVFLIAIIFNPLRDRIQRFLDKRFFKGTLESLAEEKDRLQQELFHKEKLAYVGQLASSVVHEIRNPLTTLKAFADFFPEKCHDESFIEKFRKLIPQEIRRIEAVTEQLLDLAKPREVSFTALNIAQVIESTLLLLENNFRLKKINIIKDFSPEEVIIQGDEEQLRQVFLNLFLNSIQAMDEGGTLTVSASIRQNPRGEKSAIIRIQDTGSGISEDNLKKLFTPFFTTKKQGIGLGLSISRELIEEHQGKITVESKIREGTKFTVELPVGSK